MQQPRFRNRAQAGRALAEALEAYAGRPDLLVLAPAREGVPVAYEVALALGAPLDVFLVHKPEVPGQPDAVARREREYRDGRPPAEIRGRTVVLADDALATGRTMSAAAAALRACSPASVIVAVPVGAAESCQAMRRQVARVVCLFTPEPFVAVDAYYADFRETSDAEVRELLARAARARGGPEALPSL